MKSKILIPIITSLFITSSIHAQLGVKLGTNISNVAFNVDDPAFSQSSTKARVGVNVGLTYDFGTVFVFQPGIYFSQKGYNTNDTLPFIMVNYTSSYKEVINYIEVPLNLLFKLNLDILRVYGGAGIVFGYGIGGKAKYEDNFGTEKTSEIRFRNGDDRNVEYIDNAFDIGAQIVAGIEVGRFSFNLNYNFGLLDMYDNKNDMYNRTFGVTLGFRFGEDKFKTE